MARTKSTEPKPIYRILDKMGKEWIVCSKTQAGRICSLHGQNLVLDAERMEDNGGFEVAAVEVIDLNKLDAQKAMLKGLELLGVEF